MLIRFFICVMVMTMFIKCSEDGGGFNVYKIRGGEHRSMNRVVTVGDRLSYQVIFDRSCLYEFDDEDRYDINKLFGMSDGLTHSNNSCRFGWRSKGDSIEIMVYIKSEGKMVIESIGKVGVGDINEYELSIEGSVYRYRINTSIYVIDRVSKYEGIRYHLFPYFGGNKVAPHDMIIKMR
jgi:hypothetical protein